MLGLDTHSSHLSWILMNNNKYKLLMFWWVFHKWMDSNIKRLNNTLSLPRKIALSTIYPVSNMLKSKGVHSLWQLVLYTMLLVIPCVQPVSNSYIFWNDQHWQRVCGNRKKEVHVFHPIQIYFVSLYFEMLIFEFKEMTK